MLKMENNLEVSNSSYAQYSSDNSYLYNDQSYLNYTSYNYFSSNSPTTSYYPKYFSNNTQSNLYSTSVSDTSFETSLNSSYPNLPASTTSAYLPQYNFIQPSSPIYPTYPSSFYQSANCSNVSSYDSAYQTQSVPASPSLKCEQISKFELIKNETVSKTKEANIEVSQKKRKRCANENIENFEPASSESKIYKRPKVLKLENLETIDVELNCSKCNHVFYSAAKLLMHEFVHHKNGNSKQCPICYRNFGSNSNAMVHLRGHTQEKLYQCNQCEKSFVDISTLKKHKRTHSGEKPYECNFCTRKFSQSGNLSRHLLTHAKQSEAEIIKEEPLTETPIQKYSTCNSAYINNEYTSSSYYYNNLTNQEQYQYQFNPNHHTSTDYSTAYNYYSSQYQNFYN